MFTAEELEDCDILPKKITLSGVIKFLIYFIIMFAGVLVILSVYTGKDLKHIVSLDNIKFGSQNEIFEKLFYLDSKYNYNLQEKYNFDYANFDENYFIQEYVSQSLPCIVKNASLSLPAYESFNNRTYRLAKLTDIFQKETLEVEIKSEPRANFITGNLKTERLNYLSFFEKATNNQRLSNYFLTNIDFPKASYMEIGPEKALNFTKHLNVRNIKYSEGFGESISLAHYEKDEKLICQIIGSIDIVVVPQLYRATVYSFKQGYGPLNYSPVNFFESEFGRFPKFAKSHRLLITLNQGDCLYLPAYWWFSVKSSNKSHFIYFTINFKTHSLMLDSLIKTLELDDI